jgi:tRNA N6-adenosine threonylcarbamoyltransferase
MATILGIESSCDETAAAVVRDGREVLSSVVHSQIAEHAVYGGVVPEIAGRSHLEKILPVIDGALDAANLDFEGLDAIAVTQRPGLIGSLLVGLSTAKALAFTRGLPLVGVHHIEAHVYAATMEAADDPYPCIALVVSGGHTTLYRALSPLSIEPLATTLDDAAGEAFDKVAWLLGLPYPGGPSVSALAAQGDRKAVRFPRYRAKDGSIGFSFSGLKTAVLYHLRGGDALAATPAPEDIENRADIAASFEEAVVDSLAKQTLRAARESGLSRVIVSGGVACNRRLREVMHERAAQDDIRVHFPSPAYCTDNAVMIAGLGHELLQAGRVLDWSADALAR